MKKLLRAAVPVLLAATLVQPALAQVRPALLPQAPVPATPDSLQVNLELLPDSLVTVPAPLDSVRLAWLRTPPELRDLVGDRVGCIETDVPHVFNNHVLSFVRLFTERQRTYTQRVLERENLYFPLFEKYLAKYNLPLDLKYLAVVESALIPTAKSRVGATGLWQFMGPTANDLHLRRDEWVDERMDPEKATEAACKHLRYLYGVFHDWEMVLAAYNWGAGNMQRVMRKTGKNTYWEVHSSLPAETRNYVPTFTALMYTMKYAQAHQLHSPTLKYQYAQVMDTLQLGGRAFDLTRLAQACGYSDSLALLRLNPELRKTYLPQGYRSYTLLVPAAARPALAVADRNTLFAYCQPLTDLPRPLAPRAIALTGVTAFPGRSLVAVAAPRETVKDAQPRFRRLRHTVKHGETITSVAARYDVTTAQVRRWNQLGKSSSLAGKRQLVVFVPLPPEPTVSAGSIATAAPRPTVTPMRVAASKSTPPIEPAAEPETVVAAPARPEPRTSSRTVSRAAVAEVAAADDSVPATYVVKPGDFLEKIATANGLTVAQLKAWNELNSYVLQPGQTLSLRAASEAAEHLAEATREVAAAAQAPVRRAARPAPAPTPTVSAVPPAPQLHLVQPGDTLYNISRRYQGLTVEKLRELNHLQSDAVKPGQKLIVKS